MRRELGDNPSDRQGVNSSRGSDLRGSDVDFERVQKSHQLLVSHAVWRSCQMSGIVIERAVRLRSQVRRAEQGGHVGRAQRTVEPPPTRNGRGRRTELEAESRRGAQGRRWAPHPRPRQGGLPSRHVLL